MRSNMLNAILRMAALAGVMLISGVSNAADVYLMTEAVDKQLTDSNATVIETVPMWVFACDTVAADAAGTGAAGTNNPNCADSPAGAQIDQPTGDSLTIFLNNTLNTEVSIVIPGQVGGGNPTFFVDGQGQSRVKSFTQVAPANGTFEYTWTSLRPGTYLYQSGTHPSIQVPMGLYGSLVVGPVTPTAGACATGQTAAYDSASSCHDAEAIMLFSELDPWQNNAVSTVCNATSCDESAYPSTVDYSPTYLLVNGETSANLPAVDDSGNNVLLRFLNAGLHTHTPSTLGIDMGLLAEDGNVYPGLVKQQNTVVLAAGKTLDALVAVPAGNNTFSIFDRMPDFSNNALPGGGMGGAFFDSGTGADPTSTLGLAVNDVYSVTEDVQLNVGTGAGVLFNDAGLSDSTVVSSVGKGILECIVGTISTPGICADGSFTYTPNSDFSGTDSFTYSATDGANSYGAQVTLNVSFENDAPVAADDTYTNSIGGGISVDATRGVLGNDADPDGDTLSATATTTVAGLQCDGAAGLCADGSFQYTGTAGTVFDYEVSDGGTVTSTATVTLTVNALSNITLVVQEPDGTPVTDYRWTLEEDTTWHPDPDMPGAESLATTFHKSYMPVVAQGCVGTTACAPAVGEPLNIPAEAETPFDNNVALDPAKHYYVSVLPADAMDEDGAGNRRGHTVGGAQIPPGATTVTVDVNPEPLPYAQISILVFDDSSPTNGGVDANEIGLGGFQITLEDAGGRYGISAGAMSQDADGNPLTNALGNAPDNCFGGAAPPSGVILSCPDLDPRPGFQSPLAGRVLVKNLFPAKYGIITTAPSNSDWVQTSTIEGTKVIDAWVKAGEPPFFTEFGPVGVHAFVGFASPTLINGRRAAGAGTTTITGAITNHHMSRPPNQHLADSGTYDALAHTRPWVGLNSVGGRGPNIAAVQADMNDDGTATFTIDNVPQGFDYQVVVWDSFLDQVIAYRNVPAAALAANPAVVGNIPVFQWFARLENHVYLDANGNGIRDLNEGPLAEQAVNLRWRDGSVYQSFPTDLEGFVPFDQVFPFFNWLVAEVDYTRFEATGLTVTVDHGGEVSTTGNVYNPQTQGPCTEDDVDNGWNGCARVGDSYADASQRTETGQVLTQGFQGFLGQTSVFEWGKRPYEPGKNGGISGIVYYGVTRAESDPRIAAAEPWEPGIARVPVRLYRVVETQSGESSLALVQETVTDSWDDSLPTGCPGAAAIDEQIVGLDVDQTGGITTKCYDGLRNFNQARPAVFDGGYAFNDIPAGEYVVEVVVPPGYELMKEEDVNVSFGDGYASETVIVGPVVIPTPPDAAMVAAAMGPEPGLAQPPCAGEDHLVPPTMSLFPKRNEEAPFAGATRPLCDRKHVVLSDQGQAAADFTLLTDAPIAAHFTGMILDDVAQEFNPLSPQFGEKWAPPFVPVSIRDYNGEEISRVYSDQWGRMNGLMPSTFTAYIPSPSGFSPAMHMTCMNDPGPIQGPNGTMIVDPQYNPAYSNFCYTFQYMPGTTTYLDTPVLPVSAFASGYNPPDCSLDTRTPMIHTVDGNRDAGVGPMVSRARANGNSGPRGEITITSMGMVEVPNPAYEGPLSLSGEPKTILRDFGFGDVRGAVRVGGRSLIIRSWTNDTIVARVRNSTRTGQLVVTRDNGNSSEHAITVTVYNGPNNVPDHTFVSAGQSIQAAIDNAARGDLIMIEPGVYNESVIMWKPVLLQGAGAGSTLINAAKRPTQVLIDWRDKMDSLFAMRPRVVSSLPNQLNGAAGFTVSEGAAITVLGRNTNGNRGFSRHASRIDGFSVTGADVGGGILVNSYAHNLEISNNHVYGNNGSYHGGIRIGQPFLELPAPDAPGEDDSTYDFNTGLNIHSNAVTLNGGLGGAGGGISLSTGSDQYNVSENFVCGNFTTGDGGGIGHLGLSNGGNISNNTIVHNQSFNQAVPVSGGGVFVGGEPVIVEFLELDNPDLLSTGSGDVDVRFNRIQGNQAGAGHGGGIRTQFVNGKDVASVDTRPLWYRVRIMDNVIVNNMAGDSGGGISLHNTIRAVIRRNTIAHNDSTATVGGLIVDDLSAKQPAGISTESHSPALADAIAQYDGNNSDQEFSTPFMGNPRDNILFENRSFNYEVVDTNNDGIPDKSQLSPVLSQGTVGACDPLAVYWDLDARVDNWRAPDSGAPGPTSADPGFGTTAYCNGGRTLATTPGPMFALPALDEGGNAWIDVRFGPLTRAWPEGSAPWSYEVTPTP